MPKYIKKFYALGTQIVLTVYDASLKNEDILEKSCDLVNRYEDIFTVNRKVSEVMSVNHAAGKNPVQVSNDCYELIKKAVEVSKLDYGFNVLIGPLVKLWHIGFKDAHVPEDSDIKQLLPLINSQDIVLNDLEKSVFLKKEQMEIDLGGIAKGYIADKIKELWEKENINQGIINLGGNVLLVGKGPHENKWLVGIQDPYDARNSLVGNLKLDDWSVVTSGVYERFLLNDGHVYHHILDENTGYPINTDIVSVTAVTKKSTDAEIWSGIGFCSGFNKAKELLNDSEKVGLIFINNKKEISVTDNLIGKVKIFNDLYHLV